MVDTFQTYTKQLIYGRVNAMTFNQQLIITIIDKGLLAIVLAIVGYVFQSLLARQQAQYSIRQALAPMRSTAMKNLWSKTEKVKFSSTQLLTPDDRKSFYDELTKWYYEEGGAMYLSHTAAGLFMIARGKLGDSTVDEERVRGAFSELRTQLKVDSGIYTRRAALTPIKRYHKS